MIYERAITLLSGRYGGRARPQAYLEFAQEHFLAWMGAEGLFDGDHPLVFKGGTALRKFTFGLAVRFSTDLDFAAESVEDGLAGMKPFRAGPEYVGRTASQVVGFDDLGVLSGEPLDCSALLAVIGSTYGAMGEPTGAVEIRLAQASKGDLFWAQQIYESRRSELRG